MLKGVSLLLKAAKLKPDQIWPWLAFFSGLGLGTLKAKFLFSKSCQRNLARIDTLYQPRIWQFFRPGFFVFLSLMIVIGATFSQLADTNYFFLIGLAILDFSIAIALIGSSYIFWTQGAFMKQ